MSAGIRDSKIDTPTGKRRKWIRRIASVLFAILILGTVIRLTGMRDLGEISQLNPWLLLVGIVLSGLMMTIFSVRWFIIIKGFLPSSLATFWQIYFYSMQSLLAGKLFAQTASTMVVRSASLASHEDVSLKASIGTVVTDKLFDLLLIVLSFPLFLIYLSGAISAEVALGLSVVFSLVVIFAVASQYERCLRWASQTVAWLSKLLNKVTPRYFRKGVVRVGEIEDQLGNVSRYLNRETIIWALVLSLLGELLLIGRSWFIAQAVGLDVSFPLAFLGITAAQASLFVAVTPGGVGFLEGAWIIVLASSGITGSTVGLFLLLDRFLRLVVNFVLYLLSLLLLYFKAKNAVKPS